MRKKVRVLGEYLGHLVVGAAMFTALLQFGAALHVLVQWVEPIISDRSFLRLMRIVEDIILYSDVAFVVWWALFSTFSAIRKMHDE